MECSNGHNNLDGAHFCAICGKDLTQTAQQNQSQAEVSEPPQVRLSPRTRRLQSDYNALMSAFAGHAAITVTPIGPMPPERYQVVYNVPSLTLTSERQPHRTQQTIVSVTLPPEYPREKPYLTTNYPVFHPNFGAYVCIADFWSPSQSLVDILVEVGDMLQWRLFNVKSPLNAVAARWSEENGWQLPVGNVDVLPLSDDIILMGEVKMNAEETW